MNLIDLLVRDHETVSLLFRCVEWADRADHGARRDIVEQIHDELEDHAGIVEQVFYPAVARREAEDPVAGEQLLQAHQEHRLIRNLLEELAEMELDGHGYDATVKLLKDMVQRHVAWEEGALLPRARQLLAPEELERMGEELEAERTPLRTEGMAVSSPDAVAPPPDDEPRQDRRREL
jgi:hemerythrin-like domain-containing protein